MHGGKSVLRKGGKRAHPALEQRVPGRSFATDLLEESERIGISISEHVMGLEEFLDSDEIFITSTTRQVQPVSHIEKREFTHEGEVTRALEKLFDDYVDRYLAKVVTSTP